MLLDLLVSTGVVAGLLGALLALVEPFQDAVAVQARIAERSQRQRATFDMLHHDLLMAGSGPFGERAVPPARLRPPVMPVRFGPSPSGDGPAGFVVWYARAAVATLMTPLVRAPGRVMVAPGPGCRRVPCGLTSGSGGLVMVLADTPRSDLYRVVRAEGADVWLEPVEPAGPSVPHAAGAWIVPIVRREFYVDAARQQLRVSDGVAADFPMVDGVSGLAVRYFGLPGIGRRSNADPCGPPVHEGRPAPVLQVIPVSTLHDGPWCRGFDRDLFRIRRVRVALTWRGNDDTGHPGRVPFVRRRRGPSPERVLHVDVTLRSLEGGDGR